MVTNERVKKLVESYKSNKEELKNLENYIEEYGCTDDGVTDVTESFEQGWNNALEYVFNVLGIKYKETVDGLKAREDYEFECSMNEVYKECEDHDEWGCAFIFLNNEIGVEYNYCIDDGENCSGIYKTEINEKTGYIETDYEDSIHYEIDFDDKHWMENLENAMCEALIEFFEL